MSVNVNGIIRIYVFVSLYLFLNIEINGQKALVSEIKKRKNKQAKQTVYYYLRVYRYPYV